MANEKILIVDDDEELHTLYGLYLKGASYQILEAFNGRQALDILSRETPRLIVLDMIMPELDGEGFLETLLQTQKHLEIPIVIASVNDKISQKYLDMRNLKGVIKKPFSVDVLLGKIHSIISPS